MSKHNLVTGNVYDITKYERDSGNSMRADAYFSRIGEIARNFFGLRNEIPLTERHNKVIATVHGEIAKDMKKHLVGVPKFLDVGGSSGNRLLDIENRLESGLEKYIVDVDDVSVANANSNGIYARQADITQERFPFKDGTFDAVSLLWTLETIPPNRHEHVIREIHRVLKPGGRFYFQDDKYGVSHEEESYFREVLKPRGYKRGTFFYGVFEPTGAQSLFPDRAHTALHPARDSDPAYRLIGEPMCAKGFSMNELEELVKGYFSPARIRLIELNDHEKAGNVIATSKKEIKKFEDTWAPFLAVLRKR